MSYLDHDGLAYFKSKLDRTFIADIVFDDGDILLYGGDGTLLKTVVQEGTVTQKKSTTNKEYPILLCWDADAEEDQTMKTVWYGLDARINPKFGYLYARRYYTEHPSYERTSVPSTRAEWHHVFTDAVSAPMGEVYEYLDRNSDGGEHRMELRLYGNPLSQYVDTPNHNEATDAVSIGVGATRGDTLTFFGYCPSTPIYLENGTTMRKSTVRGDQYGKDIITRDWLNLNGSITGLVHTYMDETIDGYKTFLKTVTIDSGNDNAKAGLNVQGDVNIDSGDNTKPSNLYVQGNSHIHGNEDIDGNLNVDGTSDQHGNVHMYHNLDVDGNANTDGNQTIGGTLTVTGKITGNGGAEISGGSGLKINGTTTTTNLTVTDDATIGDDLTVNGDANVAGTINKKTGNTTQEYVTYVTNQAANREAIAANLIDGSKGLYLTSAGKIGVELQNQGGLKFDSNGGLYVDFSGATDDVKDAIMGSLGIQIPLTSSRTFYVNKDSSAATDAWRNNQGVIDKTVGTQNKPFKTIQAAVNCVSSGYAIGTQYVAIRIVKGSTAYSESISLSQLSRSTGYVDLISNDINNRSVLTNTGTTNSILNCTGAGWRLRDLEFVQNLSNPNDGISHYPSVISADGAGELTIVGCKITASYTGSAPNGYVNMRVIGAGHNGQIRWSISASGAQPSISATQGNASSLSVFYTEQGGSIIFGSANDGDSNSAWHKINISGSGTEFLTAYKSASITNQGGATYPLTFNGSFTGKKCRAQLGGTISITDAGCPGNEAGTCDTSHGSWVTPSSLLE